MTQVIEYGGCAYTLELEPQALVTWGAGCLEVQVAMSEALVDLTNADHERIPRLLKNLVNDFTSGIPPEVVETMLLCDLIELFKIVHEMAKDILIEAAMEQAPIGEMQ